MYNDRRVRSSFRMSAEVLGVTPSGLKPPVIVLVRPQLAENIGAAARAMANFGATDLRLVQPPLYNSSVANRMACDGLPILEQARTFPDLAQALADCTYTIATSRRLRRVKIPPRTPHASALALTQLAPNARGALVFGPEREGLSNEELFLCDTASTIPTAEPGSLNLGQAVVVYLYEWFQARQHPPAHPPSAERLATHADKQRCYESIHALLIASHYQPRSRLPEFMRRVKILFEERALTHREQRILLKLLRYLEKLPPK